MKQDQLDSARLPPNLRLARLHEGILLYNQLSARLDAEIAFFEREVIEAAYDCADPRWWVNDMGQLRFDNTNESNAAATRLKIAVRNLKTAKRILAK